MIVFIFPIELEIELDDGRSSKTNWLKTAAVGEEEIREGLRLRKEGENKVLLAFASGI